MSITATRLSGSYTFFLNDNYNNFPSKRDVHLLHFPHITTINPSVHHPVVLRWDTLIRPVRRAELTHTGPAGGQFEAWWALAAVAAWNVDTVGVALAQVVPAVTLINIYTGGRKRRTVDINHRLHCCPDRAGSQLVDSRKESTTAPFWLQCSSDGRWQIVDDWRSRQVLPFWATMLVFTMS